MDNRYLDIVVKEMQPLFDELGFKADAKKEGVFKSENKVVAIEYDESRQLYLLKMGDIVVDGEAELSEISAWLFDESQNAKDAEAVGIDFSETLKKAFGIKRRRTGVGVDAVDLPTTSKGDAYNINAFTKKMLDFFPALKDDYKEHVAVYGNFLYLNFFGEKLVPQIKQVLLENNKKTVKKLFDTFQNGYLHGDRDTVNTIVAVISAAVADDETAQANAFAALEENKHFIDAVKQFVPLVLKDKKLSAALIK